MHPKSMHPIMSICPMLSSDTCINYDNCSKKLKSLFAVMFLKEAEGRALEGGKRAGTETKTTDCVK